EETEAWGFSNSFEVTTLIEEQGQNHQHWLKFHPSLPSLWTPEQGEPHLPFFFIPL
ncbi:hypothetical protein STEG23_026877, partial [Scotinomys teguina]